MTDVIPPYRFAPDETPWARWAQAKLVELERRLELTSQANGNQGSTQSGTIRMLGEQIVSLDQKVQDAFNDLTVDMGQVTTGNLSQSRVVGTWDKPVNATGSVAASTNVTGGGTGDFAAGLTSVGAAGLDLSTIAGARQDVWQHIGTGRYGYAPSTIEAKTKIDEGLPFTAEDVYEVVPVVWEYIGQVDIRDNPKNEGYNPDYIVPLEIGLLAQWLVKRNMGIFVIFHEDGVTPKSINYPLFGAVANLVAVRDLNERVRFLEGAGKQPSAVSREFADLVESARLETDQ